MSTILEEIAPRTGEQNLEQVYDWLRHEAESRGMKATIYTSAAKEQNGFLHLPVHLASGLDTFEFAAALQDLEDAWNEQEPRPTRRLWLLPAAKPREVSTNSHV